MMSWSKAALVCIAIVFTYIVFNLASWKSRHMLGMDEAGYYIYLPATFIYHDVGHLAFYPQMEAKYNLSNGVKWYAIYDEPGGFKLNKYPLGTAIFELPFFFAAHIVCLLQPATYPPDGYSAPYLLGSFVLGACRPGYAMQILEALLFRYSYCAHIVVAGFWYQSFFLYRIYVGYVSSILFCAFLLLIVLYPQMVCRGTRIRCAVHWTYYRAYCDHKAHECSSCFDSPVLAV